MPRPSGRGVKNQYSEGSLAINHKKLIELTREIYYYNSKITREKY